MGNYILCDNFATKTPYRIDNVQLNLYSIEELCYYIANYIPLVQEDFISGSLSGWIEKECGRPDIASALDDIMEDEDKYAKGLKLILGSGHYFTQTQLEKINEKIDEQIALPVVEKLKLRADLFMKQKKYRQAIKNYEEILETGGLYNEPGDFRYKVYYDLGCGYAKLLRLSKARSYFSKACELHSGAESRKACLVAAYLDGGSKAFEEEAKRLNVSDGERSTVILELDAVEAPELTGNLSELVKEWVRNYHDSTGL